MVEDSNKSATPPDGYPLGGDYGAAARLNCQHYLFKELLGYNIHPSIPLKNEEDFKIADIGSGTGIWLTEIYRDLPLAQLHGFDIIIDNFPPREWLPRNIRLERLDISKPIPTALYGQYDVVHVRLFMLVIQNNDPRPVLENLVNLLKPNGHLIWTEHNPTDVRIESTTPGSKSSAWQRIQDSITARVLENWSWVPNLQQHFKSSGLSIVAAESYPQPPHLLMPFVQMELLANAEMSFNTLDNTRTDSTGPSHRRLLDEAYQESKNGVAPVWTPIVIVGKKSSESAS